MFLNQKYNCTFDVIYYTFYDVWYKSKQKGCVNIIYQTFGSYLGQKYVRMFIHKIYEKESKKVVILILSLFVARNLGKIDVTE